MSFLVIVFVKVLSILVDSFGVFNFKVLGWFLFRGLYVVFLEVWLEFRKVVLENLLLL